MILLAVPNISEGRRPDLVRDIAGTDALLDVHSDPDHNRSVLTYAGTASELERACLDVIDRAIRRLDIAHHDGVHPRFGVVDVLPIVPYDGTVEDAESLARDIATKAPIPTYTYTDDLPALRRRLRAPHTVHPTAGVLCVGVRGPLIAFNVNTHATIDEAREIVRNIRRMGGVRALAFELPSRGLVQVSMNLTEPEITGPRAAYDEVARRTDVVDAEIVGLVPVATEVDGIPLRAPVRTIEDALRR